MKWRTFSVSGIDRYNSEVHLTFSGIQVLDLSDFQHIQVPLKLTIDECKNVDDLSPLENAELLRLFLTETNIENLNSLTNLSNLKEIGLLRNPMLSDISSLSQVDTFELVGFRDNPKVDHCALEPICRKLYGDGDNVLIRDNQVGGESIDAVKQACLTSTTDFQNDAQLHYYPNPVRDLLLISTPFDIIAFHLRDMNGKSIRSGQGDINEVEVSDLVAGAYLLQVIGHNRSSSIVFIKQ